MRWFDILSMYSKNELINWYNVNIVKTNPINFKTIYKKKDKDKYFEQVPKYFNETTKENIIKWMLKADQFPFSSTYKNKLEYKSLESKVDKSILSKEKYYISGHDVIHFYDYPKSNNLNLDF